MPKAINKPDVLVLLSTYNGEHFLIEQLDSIKNQEDVNIHCLIRDDGSTDDTLQILSKYCVLHPEFEFYAGTNIGVINSFNELITNMIVDDYDWISFCDQDDVWQKRKLISAIKYLNMESYNSLPVLYCSNLTIVDKNLQQTDFKWRRPPNFNKTTALIQNIATGCTEVFNRSAVALYRKGIGSHMEFHDYWMFLCCVYMGKVIYDFNSYILYRQHDANVVGAKKKNMISAVRHITKQHRKNGNRQITLMDFIKCYGPFLSNSEINTIYRIITYKESVTSRLLLVLLPRYRGSSWKVTVGFKIRALTGAIY